MLKISFEYMEIEPDKQVKYVACRLQGGASAWQTQLLQMRQREGKGRVQSWAWMKQLLRAHFLPTDLSRSCTDNINIAGRELAPSMNTPRNFIA